MAKPMMRGKDFCDVKFEVFFQGCAAWAFFPGGFGTPIQSHVNHEIPGCTLEHLVLEDRKA